MTDKLKRDGNALTEILVYNSRLGVFAENEELLIDAVRGVFRQEEVSQVLVCNAQGALLMSQSKFASPKGRHEASRSETFDALRKNGDPCHIKEGKETYEFWRPVISLSGSNEMSLSDFCQQI